MVTRVGDGDFAQSQARDLRRRFSLSLLAPLRVEETRILYCDRSLPRDEHDQIEIVGVVGVGLVRQDLHYPDGSIVVSERRGDLALHFPFRRDLEYGARPPALGL